MATWKKVHVEDASTQHGAITAQLTDVTDVGDGNLSVVLVLSDGTEGDQNELVTSSVTFGTAAFDAASSFATSAQGALADSSVQPGDFLKDLVAGTGLSGGADNILYGADSDITVNLDIDSLAASSGTITVASDDLVALYDGSNHYKSTVSELVAAVSTGVTSLSATNGLSVDTSTGDVTVEFDTSTLGTQTVSSATEFVVSNTDTEGVAAASAIGLEVFSNSTTAFIDLEDLSVTVASAGTANLAYNNSNGVFTYTPPDLSSYQTIAGDVHASSFAYTGGTTNGPTGTLTLSDSSTVGFGAIPSASGSASGIVTNAAQTFGGNKTFADDVIITGDLTINGDTTTVSTTNLLVQDTFIALNSEGSTNVDAGIVFTGAANKVFGWDQSQESGRFGVDYAGGDATAAGGGFAPDAWVSTVHTAAGDDTNATAALAQIGNIYINSSNQDIYIYS